MIEDLKFKKNLIIQNIAYLETKINNVDNEMERDHYKHLYYGRMQLLKQIDDVIRTEEEMNLVEMTIEELRLYNGENGNKAYVAVDGIIYDVTDNNRWFMGDHYGLSAGLDLTYEFKNCHNKNEILNKLEKVGVLKDE